MADRSHLSIGEVLSLLQDEFPDVTISKIRFLESQGLVDPERTPSGYRKFYEDDIERLRWVLRQQRDSFLPLKVIKGRLDHGEEADDAAAPPLGLGPAPHDGGDRPEQREPAFGSNGRVLLPDAGPGEPEAEPSAAGQLFDVGPPYAALSPSSGYSRRARPARPAKTSRLGRAEPNHGVPSVGSPEKSTVDAPATWMRSGTGRVERLATAHARAARAARLVEPPNDMPKKATPKAGTTRHPAQETRDDELTGEELAKAAGVDNDAIRDLERYGLISPRVIGGTPYYSHGALVVAQLAGAFARHGVEARHLRAYKSAAEREAGIVQQVIMPLIKQRNPEARHAAAEAADELAELGGQLRAALLQAALAEMS
jgi:DNA-binding transcriptional MerR regulator